VASAATKLSALRERTIRCTRCPELRAYCRAVARAGKREFAGQAYWGKPLPSIGPSNARLLIVGLAPAAHGGNRTGRMFTGDGSAAWLARALHRNGFATSPTSVHRGDAFAPIDAVITAALRCAPPKNKPTPAQLVRCSVHLQSEVELLRSVRVVVGLGKIGFDAAARAFKRAGYRWDGRKPAFAHRRSYHLHPPAGRAPVLLVGSYHPSRQNTNTGKLTQAMLDAVFADVRRSLDAVAEGSQLP
jgi:uracil-DNA glycosylase